MFEMAETYLDVDKAHSWMIGDKLIDVQAGRNYGVRTVLVGTGYGAKEHEEAQSAGGQPYDIYAETLPAAAEAILGRQNIDKESECYEDAE